MKETREQLVKRLTKEVLKESKKPIDKIKKTLVEDILKDYNQTQ